MKLEQIENYFVFSEEKFTKKDMLNEEKALVFTLNLLPGQEIPPHRHGESGLIIHVLNGTGELIINNEITSISAGTVIYCSGDELFAMKNTSSENLNCFAILTKSQKACCSK